MLSIVVTDKSGAKRLLEFDKTEITVGRLDNNDVVLPKNNVSKRHSQVAVKDGRAVVSDLKSTNGTYVNGRRIAAPLVLKPGDKVYIGDFILTVEAHATQQPTAAVSPVVLDPLRTTAEHAMDRLRREGLTRDLVPGVPRPQSAPPPPPPPQMPSLRMPALADSLRKRAKGDETSVAANPLFIDATPDRGRAASVPPPVPGGLLPQEPTVSVPFSPFGSSQDAKPAVPRDQERAPSARPPAPPDAKPEGRNERPSAPVPKRQDSGVVVASASDAPPRVSSQPPARGSMPPSRLEDPDNGAGPRTSPAVLTPSVRLQGALRSLMERLSQHVDVFAPRESAFSTHDGAVLENLIDELAAEGVVSADLDRVFLREAAISEAFGLGPLDRLLANSSVREIVVDGPSRIMVDMGAGLSAVSTFMSSKQALLCVAQRLAARAGGELEERVAVQEHVLPSGGHVQVLLPPLSPRGPLLSIRCAPRVPLNLESLVTQDMLSNDMANVLRAAVRKHRNIVVLGPAGAGVTTTLAVLAGLASDHERVVTVEDVPVMAVDHGHVLPLVRPSQQPLGELLRHVSRLRADIVALDDVRGAGTRDVLMAALERSGILLGLHAPSVALGLQQLEQLSGLSSAAAVIAQAVQVLVHVGIDSSGQRRVVGLSEIIGARQDALTVRELYRFDGAFRATEHRASFL